MRRYWKKFLGAVLAACIALSGAAAWATPEMPETSADSAALEEEMPIAIGAKAALLMDVGTGEVLLQKGAADKRYAPGVTRLLSALLILEDIASGNMTLDEKVAVSPKAAKTGGTTAFLDAGGAYTVRALLKAMGIVGANDAVVALAERSAGAEEAFVQRMNQRGEQLGLTTRFVDCTGMNAKEQPVSANDIAIIGRALAKQGGYFPFSSVYMENMEHANGRVSELVNPNRLVRFFAGCDGLGTGSSRDAGYAGVYTAKRGDLRLLCVVLEAENNAMRNTDAQKMLEYGFANYRATKLFDADEVVKKNIPVLGGRRKFVNGRVEEPFSMLLKKGEEKNIEQEIVIKDGLSAPLKAGEQIGEVILRRGGEEAARIPVVSDQDVEAADYWYSVRRIGQEWTRRY